MVSAEYRVIAANGTDCQTISVARIAKAAVPSANRGYRSKDSKPSEVSDWLTMPNSEWNSHWKTVVAATTGIAQARTSEHSTTVRPIRPSRSTTSATRVAITMIRATLIAMNRNVRRTTSQHRGSDSSVR